MGEWLENGAAGERAYVAVPESGSGPGVLVLHAWWGLTADFTGVCDRLAAHGFVALAPSLYPGGQTATTIPEAEALRDAADRPEDAAAIAARTQTALEQLRGLPAVRGAGAGVIGFSMGAYWALHVAQARPDDIRAVVVVYGTGEGDFAASRAAYQGHFAEQDDYEPLDWVRQVEHNIRAAGRDVTFYIYPGTGHWFLEPSQPAAYNAAAAELVWERTLAFFKDQLG
jgi:carboxymethylenebutenolidase